ncbi:oxidoreductase [Paenibacillus sp. CAA11]|uniref:SDR family NAD(P)-dependent oxidoreductase n=1 Tax=Paenibacillus sp. CAA11 TaxID=1532905 RepID=UPI000D332C85|nr:SDR family NAD(P)-dependent oxidoreductase [Paenibacillus sp. CAA11]AWB46490.1 oxidoreductase [Paenibacillus sp. CAA11]
MNSSNYPAQKAKTVVITGASSGFGKGVALKLARQGFNLVLAARRTALLEELAQECGSAVAVTTDVSKPEEVARLAQTAIDSFGGIDVWINNAGIGAIGSFTDIPLEDHIRIAEINVIGVINGSHYALRQFKQQKFGTLINLASIAGKIPFPFYPSYSASKFAVLGLSGALHQKMELEGYDDIHVCSVSPWATDTPWFDHAGNYSGHEAQMKPLDDPEDVIDAIVKLIDEPKESIEVGALTKGSFLSSNLAPGLTENFNAKYIYKVIQEAPPAPPTSGSLHKPMASGTDISAGLKQRIEAQKEDK